METWLEENKNTVEFFSKLLGFALAIAGVVLTLSQLKDAARGLQFSNEYNVYKDSRDILKMFVDDPGLFQSLKAENIGSVQENIRDKTIAQVGLILNFYSFALGPESEPRLSPELRKRIIKDYCQIARFPLVAPRLAAREPEEAYFALAEIKRAPVKNGGCNV